jgi:hypothetical protein
MLMLGSSNTFFDGQNKKIRLGNNFIIDGDNKKLQLDDTGLYITATDNKFEIIQEYSDTTRTFSFNMSTGVLKLEDSKTGNTWTYTRTQDS